MNLLKKSIKAKISCCKQLLELGGLKLGEIQFYKGKIKGLTVALVEIEYDEKHKQGD